MNKFKFKKKILYNHIFFQLFKNSGCEFNIKIYIKEI